MRKKILHIIPSLIRGGAETLLCNSIEMLPEYDHIVIVFNKSEDDIPCITQVISLECRLPRDILKARKSLKEIIKREKPDIIHSHLYWANILSRFINTPGVKKIQQYHSDLYDKTNSAQYSRKMLLLDKLTYRSEYTLVFVSDFLRERISRQLSAKRNTHVLYNFVPDHFFELKSNKAESNEVHILNVANLRREKNQEVLIKAMVFLKAPKVFLQIAGEGPERNKLEETIQGNNLHNTKLLGKREDISALISESNLYITTSLHEGFGISLIEAMAAGLPCIVSDIDVFKEVGRDGVIYYSAKNPQDLAEKILRFQSIDYRREWSQKAKKRAAEFTADIYKENLILLYRSKSYNYF